MKKLFFLILFANLLGFSNLIAQTLIVENDTTIFNTKYDTIIVKNGGRLHITFKGTKTYKNEVQVSGLMMVDSGGKLIGDGDRGYICVSKTKFINNSGLDSIENISLNMTGDKITIGGNYPVQFNEIEAGWGDRNITLETTLIVWGAIFEGHKNLIYLNGNDLVLGSKAYFRNLPAGQQVIQSDPVKGGRVIVKVKEGLCGFVPLGEFVYSSPTQSEIYFTVNKNCQLGSDPSISFEMFVNDSLPLPSNQIIGSATKNYLKRWLRVSCNDITVPDLNIRFNEAENGIDTVGNSSEYFSALWDGSKWNYQSPYNTYYKIVEWTNMTSPSAIITAGKDLGASAPTCSYEASNIRFKNVGNRTSKLFWNKASSSDKEYNIKLRQKGNTLWTTLTSDTNYYFLTGLNSATSYELKIQTVCQSNDTSHYTAIQNFHTSVANYDSANNNYSLSTTDTIPSFIEYTNININAGGIAYLNDDIQATSFLQVYGNGTLCMDNYFLYGTATPRLYNYSTLRYSQKKMKGDYDSPFRTGKTAAVQAAASFILNGNNTGGQFLDEAFLSTVYNLTIDATNIVYLKRNPITVTGTFTFKQGDVVEQGGKLNLSGDSLINHNNNEFLNASVRVTSVNYILSGSQPLKIKNLSVGLNAKDPLKTLTLNNDLTITNNFSLHNGRINLRDKNITINKIEEDTGFVFADTAGTVNILLKDYSEFSFPFGNQSSQKIPVIFNLTSGNIGSNAMITLNMRDSIPATKGSGPVDYLSRYLRFNISDVSNPEFNIAFTYDSASDVIGTEAFMENELWTGNQWKNSYLALDSVNKKVYWSGLTQTGLFSAGNYLGYTYPKAIDLKVNDITTNGATFNWVFLDEGVNNWTIKYKPLSSPTWNSVTGISNLSKRISGSLTSGTGYEWYVLTNQTAGYSYIDSSARDTFTTKAGSCNQPIAVQSSNSAKHSIKLHWDEGVNPFSIEYKKFGYSWDSSIIVNAISDTFYTLTGLEEQTKYIARIKSSCGDFSDTIIFHTTVRGLVDDILTIDTIQTIPQHFTFRKIIIKPGGYATASDDLYVKDSVIVKTNGYLALKDHVFTGYCFQSDSASTLFIGNKNGIVDDDDLFAIDTIGNIQTIVRNYQRRTRLVFNGIVPQQLYKLNNSNNMYNLTIDNPTTVQCFTGSMTIKDTLRLKQGMITFDKSSYKLNLDNNSFLINDAGENALNNHNCYLLISGGENGFNNGATILGTKTTYVDTLVQVKYDEAYIKSDLRIGHYMDLAYNIYYYGIRLYNARLILDPGVTINTNATRIMLMDTGSIVYIIDSTILDQSITIPIGIITDNLPFTFNIEDDVTLGANPSISVTMYGNKLQNISGSSYINRYFKVKGNDISNLSYDFTLSYLDADVVGTENILLNSFYDSTLWQLDTVNYTSNKIVFLNLNKWGHLTASSGTKYVYEVSPLPNSTGVALDEVVKVFFDSQVTNVSYAGITIKDQMGDTLSGVSSTWDNATKTLTINHNPFPDKDKLYTVLIPAGNVYKNSFTNPEHISWSFYSTGTPRVKTSVPFRNATKVSVTSDLKILWDIDVDSIDFSGIYLMDTLTKTKINISIFWDNPNNTITITHPTLSNYTVYEFFINDSAVKNDTFYNKEFTLLFRTILKKPEPIDYFPIQNQSNVSPLSTSISYISVDFNQEIFEKDFTKAYVINQNAAIINLQKSIIWGTSFAFEIGDGDLDYNSTYTVVIPSGTICNEEGVFNDSISWKFSTIQKINNNTGELFLILSHVYPNPAKDWIEIVSDISGKHSTIRIFDLYGHEILNKKNISENKTRINLTGIPSGSYIIEIEKDSEIARYKLIKL